MSDTITLTFREHDQASPIITEVPRELGNVRLIEEVGQGGMGVVWRGHDEFLDRDVAVKLMRCSSIGDDQEATSLFIKGARAAAVVKHPNVVSIFHADQLEGIVYIVMEFASGSNLRAVLSQRMTLSTHLASLVIAKVLDALSTIHEAQVIHRDMKPANVIFDAEGELQVTDFGLSYVQQTAGVDNPLARGTPPYMAPEMFDGEASFQSDIYAVGLMYYELLVGGRPFEGHSVDEYCELHRKSPIPETQLRQQSVDERICDIIRRAAHKRKMFRYKTARHMLQALEDVYPRILKDELLERQLREFVLSSGRDTSDATPGPEPASPAASYFDLLTQKAQAKRHRKDDG